MRGLRLNGGDHPVLGELAIGSRLGNPELPAETQALDGGIQRPDLSLDVVVIQR